MLINLNLLKFQTSIKKDFLNSINLNPSLKYVVTDKDSFENEAAKNVSIDLKLQLSIFIQVKSFYLNKI